MKFAADGWFEKAKVSKALDQPTQAGHLDFRRLVLEGQTPIMWHRLPDFQLIALKSIAEQALRHSHGEEEVSLYIPGELLRQRLVTARPIVLYHSRCNPGAAAFAREVQMMYKVVQITDDPSCLPRSMAVPELVEEEMATAHSAPTHFLLCKALTLEPRWGLSTHGATVSNHCNRQSGRYSVQSMHSSFVCPMGADGTFRSLTILYDPCATDLNVDTFVGEEGKRLANEVRAAMEGELPIIMPHEIDPARGGCPFERFFSTTPADLIRNGLYKKLALPCFPGEQDRKGSMAIIAKAGLNFCKSKKGALCSQSSARRPDWSESKSRITFSLGSVLETSIVIRAPSFQLRKPGSAGQGAAAGVGTATGGDDVADSISKRWVTGWLGSMRPMAKLPRRGQMVQMVTATAVRGKPTAAPI